MFDGAKLLLRDGLGLPPAVVLALLGLLAHLALNGVLRRRPGHGLGLLAPLLLGVAIEGWEIWLHHGPQGPGAASADPWWQIGARHARDVGWLLLLPAALVAGTWPRRR